MRPPVPPGPPAVRRRVHQAVADLRYQPNPAARALATGRSDVLDLVVIDEQTAPFGSNPFYARVVGGIVHALADTPAHLRIQVADHDSAADALARVAGSTSLGAVLVNVPARMAAQMYHACDRVVSLGATASQVPAVQAQNVAGAYAAVRHLHDTGRRRIVAIHGPRTHAGAIERRAGFRGAIRDAGLPLVSACGDFRREVGAALTRQLLATHADLNAIFVACDLTASGVLQALAQAGRQVPDDVAVVGFDDSVIAACACPPMSSVRQPVEEMAAAAVHALGYRRLGPAWRRVFPASLVVRASSR